MSNYDGEDSSTRTYPCGCVLEWRTFADSDPYYAVIRECITHREA